MALQTLLNKKDATGKLFQLTEWKHIEQSERPQKIKESILVFGKIYNLFRQVEPLIQKLDLLPDVWRNYAHWVGQARSIQLIRKKEESQQLLYMLAFVYHQYAFRQDFLIRIAINAFNKFKGDFQKYEKEKNFEFREQHRLEWVQLKEMAISYRKNWEEVCDIMNKEGITAEDKVERTCRYIRETEQLKKREKEFEILEENAPENLYPRYLKSRHSFLSKRIGEVIKVVEWDSESSNLMLYQAIRTFQRSEITDLCFCKSSLPLFKEKQRNTFYEEDGKLNVRTCKAAFYMLVIEELQAGKIYLKYSYKYRSIHQYLIDEDVWKENKSSLLKQSGLSHLTDFKSVIRQLEKELEAQWEKTNLGISENPYLNISGKGIIHLITPAVEKPQLEPVAELMKKYQYTTLKDILLGVNEQADFMNILKNRQIKYDKSEPSEYEITAGLISYGCNIGAHKMGKIAKGIHANRLLNALQWHFHPELLRQTNERIIRFTRKLPIHRFFRHDKFQQTSSDGQKFNSAVDSLNAGYSFKYFGTGKGVSVYSFVDEGLSAFYTTVISASEREASYVLDGLLYNEVYWEEDRKWLHHTDTHGQSEVMFATCNLLGVSLAPRIKGLKKKHLYGFQKPSYYKDKGYKLLPKHTIQVDKIEQEWDTILRMMVTLKLKHTTASSLLNRLSSYARQHSLYQALQQLGRVYQTIFILKYYDELELRQMIEKQLNKVERSHQFAQAVFFDNNREIRQELKEEQDTTMNCRIIIQNSIILWNCLQLSRQLIECKSEESLQNKIELIKGGSACTWQHVNMHGVYEFDQPFTPQFEDLKIHGIWDVKLDAN